MATCISLSLTTLRNAILTINTAIVAETNLIFFRRIKKNTTAEIKMHTKRFRSCPENGPDKL
jgi:hypothetical protein